jgi:predicted MFS family arabinose efflux permease
VTDRTEDRERQDAETVRSQPLGADFRRVWIGSAAATFGLSVSGVVVPLIAVQEFGASPIAVSVLIAAENVPWLVLGLLSGVYVDRWSKRSVLVWTALIRAGAFASIPILWLTVGLTYAQLLVVIALAGTVSVFSSVASISVLPAVVPKSKLVAANSRLSAGTTAANISGEGAAGLLFQWVGGPLTFIVEAMTSVVSAVTSARLSVPIRSERTEKPHLRRELAAGLRYTFGDPLFRSITLSGALGNFGEAARYSLIAVFLLTVLDAPPAMVGVLFACAGVGGLVGASVTELLGRRIPSGRLWRGALLLGALSGILVPLASPGAGLAVFAVGYLGAGFFSSISLVLGSTARQAACPPHLIGRLSATSRTLTWGVIPLGALTGGALGSALGVREALWSILTIPLLTWAIIMLGPLRRVDRLEELGGD